MYDVAREQRNNNIRAAVNLLLLVGVLGLIAFGDHNLVTWLLLVTLILGLRGNLVGRRALSRLSTGLVHHDRAG